MHSVIHSKCVATCLGIVIAIGFAAVLQAAMNPSFDIDPQVLEGFKPPGRPAPKPEKRVEPRRVPAARVPHGSRRVQHTVRAGDNLHRILMRDYGLSDAQAEASVKEILRENRISDIRRLKIGQKIILPVSRRGAGQASAAARRMNAEKRRLHARLGSAVPSQALRIEPPALPADQETVQQLDEFWKKLVPHGTDVRKPLTFTSPAFSLTLDPQRYPVYDAMDGVRIIVDRNDSIPPLLKSLVTERDPSVRFISGGQTNGRKLLSAMLGAAGFYSVEENFVMEFGVDPKIKVHADFKVEKTSESLIRQDVVLLNSGSPAFPQPLVSFLEKQGFRAIDAAPTPPLRRPSAGQVRQITGRDKRELVDGILTALSVPYRADFYVDVFGADNNGISLSVKVDRYYERDGKRYVVTGFHGDPVAYSLLRILETAGYHAVTLEANDDFRAVSEKILRSLQLPAIYAQQEMWPDNGSGYSLSMSGFRLERAAVPGGSLFLTDLGLDPIVRELLTENGYDVQSK